MPFLRTEFDEGQGYFSPDGRWVAYYSDESGRYEIYVRPFSAGSPGSLQRRPQVAGFAAGGVEPRWRADGRELYYVALDGKLMAVEVTSGQVFRRVSQTFVPDSGGASRIRADRHGGTSCRW